jgi:hypothetical protein
MASWMFLEDYKEAFPEKIDKTRGKPVPYLKQDAEEELKSSTSSR